MSVTPDIWQMLFEQTPQALRWALGFLTLGLFTLAGWLWKRQHERVTAIEGRERDYVTREEFNQQMAYLGGRIDSGFKHLDNRMDKGFRSVHQRIDTQYKGQSHDS